MISDTDIETTIKTNSYVILKFTAEWCESCKKYNAFINNLQLNNKNIVILEIDYDLNEDLIEEYEISSLPTLIYYRYGNLIIKIEKFITKSELLKKLEEN